MRINVHTSGFDLTNHTRDFVQSKLLSTLGRFRGRIGSVAVNLATSNGRSRPDTTACEIVVNVHPAGEVRRRAEHEWMHVAIDRAASRIGDEIERELLRRASEGAPPSAGRAHQIGLSHRKRSVREWPAHDLRPLRVSERWRPPVADEQAAHQVHRDGTHARPKSGNRRWSRPLSRVY
jgi:ribosomal subunit interface protein